MRGEAGKVNSSSHFHSIVASFIGLWFAVFLYRQIDDLDIVQLGLLSPTSEFPPWARGSLKKCAEQAPQDLTRTCYEAHQLGLLESALKETGFWKSLSRTHQSSIENLNNVAEITGFALLEYASRISAFLSEANIRHAFLKGLITAPLYYQSLCQRPFKDIDLITDRKDAVRTFTLLTKLGFSYGHYDERLGILQYSETAVPEITGGYELPTLWIEVPIEADQTIYKFVRRRLSRRLFTRGKQLFARIPIEIHFRLSDVFDLTWETCCYSITKHTSLIGLEKTVGLFYHLYKGYTDLFVFKKRYGIKLIADGYRQLHSDFSAIDWPHLFRLSRNCKLIKVLQYFLWHAHTTFHIEEARPSYLQLATPDEVESLDFGDFLPMFLRQPKSFALQFGKF